MIKQNIFMNNNVGYKHFQLESLCVSFGEYCYKEETCIFDAAAGRCKSIMEFSWHPSLPENRIFLMS